MTIRELCNQINKKYDRKVCGLASDYLLEQHKFEIEELNRIQEEKNKICDGAGSHNLSYEDALDLIARIYY